MEELKEIKEVKERLEKFEKINETVKKLEPDYLTDSQKDLWKKSAHSAVDSYTNAVRKVYDGKNEDIINLMNGLAEEERKDKDRIIDDAISSLSLIPYGFARIINVILNTTYTNDDFNEVVKQDVLSAAQHLKWYIEETRQEKRRLTNAEEMRKELDEAKEVFERLKHQKVEDVANPIEEKKLSFFEKIKKLFCCKKCKKQ